MAPKVDLQDIIADLEEAKGFAAMSPAGRDNITSALDSLEDAAEETYRKGFVDGEKLKSPAVFTIGDETMAKVFKPNGIENVSNLQAVFDAVEAALVANKAGA